MRSSETKFGKVRFYVFIAVLYVIVLFPFFWMMLSSFKHNSSLMQMNPDWFSGLTLDNYREVLQDTAFFQYVKNSLIVSTFAVCCALTIGLPAAYSIARFRMTTLSLTIMIAKMIPGISLLVPWFIIFRAIGIIDTYLSLVISHLVLTLPLTVWVMISFIEDIPFELEEAALIDGCSRFNIFRLIVLPLIQTGIVTVSILGFIFSWNHFIFALVLSGAGTQTVPIVVFQFMQFDEINYGGLYAAATMTTFPILAIVYFVRNQFVSGLTMGGTKG